MRRQAIYIRFLSWWILAVAFCVPLKGQILIDDFSDGNDDGWTHRRTGEGEAWGPGIFDASSGEYQLRTTGTVPQLGLGTLSSFWDGSTDPLFANGIWRANVRADTAGTNIAFTLRGARDGPGYLMTTSIFGELQLWNCDGIDCTMLRSIDVGFTSGENWILEAGTEGSLITGKMWRQGDPAPNDPQLSQSDGSRTEGQFGVVSFIDSNWSEAAKVSAVFDDIYFSPVPEPSAVLLTLFALAGLGLFRKKCWPR